jgi:hypothetical protein
VWQHYVGRFGREPPFGSEPEVVDAEKRKAARARSRIIGGPVTVPAQRVSPWETDARRPLERLFVAVARDHPEFQGFVPECVVYEVAAEDGKPVAIGSLPRVVLGSLHRVVADGVVWACEAGGVAKLSPSQQLPLGAGGMFNAKADCVARVVYYREPADAPAAPAPWLRSGKSGDPIALSERALYRLPAGGAIAREGDRVMRSPIDRVDLATGATTAMSLAVPFRGEAKAPDTNYSRRDGTIETFGPHLFAITGLAAHGVRFEVTLASEEHIWLLSFDLGD